MDFGIDVLWNSNLEVLATLPVCLYLQWPNEHNLQQIDERLKI